MKAKRSYKIQTPHGLITRTSDREYSHVVTMVMTLEDGRVRPVEYVFCGRLDLAQKAAASFRKNATGLVEKDPASDPGNWKLRKVPAKNVDVQITAIEADPFLRTDRDPADYRIGLQGTKL